MTTLRNGIARLWRSDRFLVFTGGLMLVALIPMLAGLVVDPRTITGTPAWLKPAKFAVSTAIYSFTLAWILGFLPDRRRVRWTASRVTGSVFILEVAIISLQAWRGTTSHFNVGTPLDAALFNVMGAAIIGQTLSAVLVAIALWRQTFTDRAVGWALRLGLAIAIAGASTGGLMTRPTEAQLALARTGQPPAFAGAHTVGAPDGGPGLPGTGWSTRHGDVRVAHFAGLHAVQALPLLALLLRRRQMPPARRERTIHVAAGSYAALFGILLWQALRGQSIVAPDALTMLAFGVWATLTAAGLLLARRTHVRHDATQRKEWVSA